MLHHFYRVINLKREPATLWVNSSLTASSPRAMLNLHLQAAERELVKIIPLVFDLQVVLGRRPASECSKQNGFFAQENHSSISREHAILKIDTDQQVGRCTMAQ